MKISKRLFYFIGISLTALIASAQPIPYGLWKRDPCQGTPALGSKCRGGAIYAGQFDGGKYMVTPGGCTDEANPTCAGGTDTITAKYWYGSTGSSLDIAGVETLATAETVASSSSFRGHVNTPLIVASASVSADSAADVCDGMNFGGFTDWYLPSKSELAYIYCHATVLAHSTSNPQENANCTGYGGKTTELTGFNSNYYWSSTEYSSAIAWRQTFVNGTQVASGKGTTAAVRCVRRY